MREGSRLKRAATAILFSLIMAWLLGIGGFLAGSYLWGHYGRPANDPDDTDAYLAGLLVGGAAAISGGTVLLWKFWPRVTLKSSSQAGHSA